LGLIGTQSGEKHTAEPVQVDKVNTVPAFPKNVTAMHGGLQKIEGASPSIVNCQRKG
jgi:hypothetical protein